MRTRHILSTLALVSASFGVGAAGDYAENTYRVTITNITAGISFTPVLVAPHTRRVGLFELGEASSEELAALAEGGDTMPLADALNGSGFAGTLGSSAGLLGPGASAEVEIMAPSYMGKLSLAAMLLPTNDTFVALNAVPLPKGAGGMATYYAKAYDAGSEPNDELCENIPGPRCGGAGGSPDAGGEGYVYPAPGIHGEGDLSVRVYNWTDPVAKVTVELMR